MLKLKNLLVEFVNYIKDAPIYRRIALRVPSGRLHQNSLYSMGQSVVLVVVVFLAYRLVVTHAGLERFGVWSLLIAGSALVRVGDVSGAGALARFVATSSFDGDVWRRRDVVHTVMLTSLAINGLMGLMVWVAAPFVLPLFIPTVHLAEAQMLVPYVVVSLVLGSLALAVTSAIDGAQRADQRALVVIAASLTFLIACATLIPIWGVAGFGAAQLIQQITVLVLGMCVLRRHIAGLTWLPRHWRRDIFLQTTGYSLKLSSIGLLVVMFDPLAKFAFNYVGGTALVGLYEVASRLIVHVRSLVISAATPLVPAFAASSSQIDSNFVNLLEKSTRLASVAAVGVAAVTVSAAPLVSLFVLEELSIDMLNMTITLTLGWSLQLPCLAFYFAAQGLGVLRWNFVGQAAIAASALVGVMLPVPAFGFSTLLVSMAGGLALSAILVLFGNASALGVEAALVRLRWWLLGSALAVVGVCVLARLLIAAVTST